MGMSPLNSPGLEVFGNLLVFAQGLDSFSLVGVIQITAIGIYHQVSWEGSRNLWEEFGHGCSWHVALFLLS